MLKFLLSLKLQKFEQLVLSSTFKLNHCTIYASISTIRLRIQALLLGQISQWNLKPVAVEGPDCKCLYLLKLDNMLSFKSCSDESHFETTVDFQEV